MTRCLTLRTAVLALLVPTLLSLAGVHTWAKEPDKDKTALHAKQAKKKIPINRAKSLHQVKAVRSAKVVDPAAQLAKLDRKLDLLIGEVRKLQREINRQPGNSARHRPGAKSAHPNIHRRPGRNTMHGPRKGHDWMRPSGPPQSGPPQFGPPQFGPPPFAHGGPPWMSMKGPHPKPWMHRSKSDRPDQARRGPGGPHGHGPMFGMEPQGPQSDRPDQARRGPGGPHGHGPMFGMEPHPGPQGPMRAGRGMQRRGPDQDRPNRPEAKRPERSGRDGPPRGDRGPKRDRGAEKDSDRDTKTPN